MIIIQKSAEVKLMELLGVIRDPAGWQAVHFHFDKLSEQYKSEYQIKIAINLTYDLLKSYEGGIYRLEDSDIIVVCSEIEPNILNKLIFQLRYLYMDDALSYYDDGGENPEFCSIYDLSHNMQEFMAMCGRKAALSARKSSFDKPDRQAAEEVVRSRRGGGIDLSRFAVAERDLQRADLSRVLHLQPVCAVYPDMTIRKVFDEMYIHISRLRKLLKTEVDFLSNRRLFRYFTQLLDLRVLEIVGKNSARYAESPVSLNLNVDTLMSAAFAEFDSLIKPSAKVSIVIEVQLEDLFADLRAFHSARSEVQRLGYRICLDGVTSESFPMIDRAKLGVDLLKLQWNADFKEDLNSKENEDLAKAVSRFGSNRVVLCRCDNKQAVRYGQALGISLFQGRYIDSLVNPDSKIEN